GGSTLPSGAWCHAPGDVRLNSGEWGPTGHAMASTDKRARELSAVAEAKGLRFEDDDIEQLGELPLALFRQTGRRPAQHLMIGRSQGVQVRGFEYPYQFDSKAPRGDLPMGSPILLLEDGHTYSGVL